MRPSLWILPGTQIHIPVEDPVVQVTSKKRDLPHEALDPGLQSKCFAIVKGCFCRISRHLDQPEILGSVNLCLLFQMDQF